MVDQEKEKVMIHELRLILPLLLSLLFLLLLLVLAGKTVQNSQTRSRTIKVGK